MSSTDTITSSCKVQGRHGVDHVCYNTIDPPRPPTTAFNPGGRRFFAAVMSPPDDDANPQHLVFPHPGYHDYEVYEWLAPAGYQPVATFKGSPNAGDSRTLALDYATWLNERFP